MGHVVNAAESNTVPPVHGRAPATPTAVTIMQNNGVASVTNSPYSDPDNDDFERFQYQWSPSRSGDDIVATTPTFNLQLNQEIYVRVSALASTGFPQSTKISQWSEWSPGYKVAADIYTFGTCNSNDFVLSNQVTAESKVFLGQLSVNGTVFGTPSTNDREFTVSANLEQPIKSFSFWHANHIRNVDGNKYLEHMSITYMNGTTITLVASTNEGGWKVNNTVIPSSYSATDKYSKGARVVGITACGERFASGAGFIAGYTGIRFALSPVQ